MQIAVIVQVVAILISTLVFIAAVSHRDIPKSLHYIFMAWCIHIYTIGYFLEVLSHSLDAAYIATRLQYFGLPFIGAEFYLFIRNYYNRALRNRFYMGLLFIVPVVSLFTANLWPYNTLFFSSLGFSTVPTPHIVVGRGPLYFLDIAYNMVMLAAGGLVILRQFGKTASTKRWQQPLMFLIATAFPLCSMLLFVLDFLHIPFDFGPISLSLTLSILGYYILKHRRQAWLPYAYERIVHELKDGFILVDSKGCFLDANEKAQQQFPVLRGLAAGTPIGQIQGLPPAFTNTDGHGEEFALDENDQFTLAKEFSLGKKESRQYFRLSSSPIEYENKVVCTCLLLYDVTELHVLLEQMRDMATHDNLTSLLNRASFFWEGNRIFQIHMRSGQPLSMLMLDIDFFKRVNDTYGHQCGDDVLRALANIMRSRLGSTDICGRYGGEEFCVLLPGADAGSAKNIADDLRRAIAEQRFQCGEKSYSITISVGVAQADRTCHSCLEELLTDADTHLYEAKENGRNQVVV